MVFVPHLPMLSLPSWMKKPVASSWVFDTSEGAEFDAAIFAAGKGSFYIKDTNDPDQIVHEILYVGMGLSSGKGPIPAGIGAAFSSPDMWSEGVGPIGMNPSRSSLTASDFGGMGIIASGASGIGRAGRALTIICFGFPPFIKATGRMRSKQMMTPSAGGGTIMPVFFTVDP